MTIISCSNCGANLCTYSRCFDCKEVIQWICYRCQWESNLEDHSRCHKNISVASAGMGNMVKPASTFTWKSKTDDLFSISLQKAAVLTNLLN